MPRVSPNDLRRSFATWLAENGVGELVTSALMGHANSSMLRRVYARVGVQAKALAMSKLPNLTTERRRTKGAPGGRPVDCLRPGGIRRTQRTKRTGVGLENSGIQCPGAESNHRHGDFQATGLDAESTVDLAQSSVVAFRVSR